jgi:hypothetical protein
MVRQRKYQGYVDIAPIENYCPDEKLITEPKPFYNQAKASLLCVPEGFLPFTHSAGNLPFPYQRHLKSASPQVLAPDNEMKAGIFRGKVIIVAGGK